MSQNELPIDDMNADLVERITDIDPPPEKWGKSLARMVDVLAVHFQRHGRDSEAAIAEAQQVVTLIAIDQGGRPLYLPRGDRLRQALIAREIYLLHNGRNTDALAERFGYTVRHVQRLYAEQRALYVRKVQGRLFPD